MRQVMDWRVGALVLACVAGGCAAANPERVIAERRKIGEPYAAEIRAVAEHVRPEHIAECKAAIEKSTTFFGSNWALTAPLQPHIQSTCQMQGSLYQMFSGVKLAAYMAPVRPADKPHYPPSTIMGCAMVLKDGTITVKPFMAPTKAPIGSECHRVMM